MSQAPVLKGALPNDAPTFQQLIQRLNAYWAERGCVLIQPLDVCGTETVAQDFLYHCCCLSGPVSVRMTQGCSARLPGFLSNS